jgi:hypothetical protein
MVTLNRDERGVLNALLIPLAVVSLLFVATLVFAFMAFSSGQDYKNNSDEKSAAAVSEAVKKEAAKKSAEFAEASKSPVKTYNGPAAYGSVQVQYPKTWSGYVVEQNSGGANVDGYFNPNVVPSVNAQASSFALRVKVLSQSYASVLQSLQGAIKSQKLTATPYAFPKVPSVVGTKFTGDIQSGKQGTMVVVPLRDSTIEVWTEGTSAVADFNTYVLPNFSFAP